MMELVETSGVGYVREDNRCSVNETASCNGPRLSILNSSVCNPSTHAILLRLRLFFGRPLRYGQTQQSQRTHKECSRFQPRVP